MKSGWQGLEASPQGTSATPIGHAPKRHMHSPDTEAELDYLLSPSAATSPNVPAVTALNLSPFPEALMDLTKQFSSPSSPLVPTAASQDETLEHLQELLRGPEVPSPLTGSLLMSSPTSASQLLAPLPQITPKCTDAAVSLESKLLYDWLRDPDSVSTPSCTPTLAHGFLSQVTTIPSCVSICNCSVLCWMVICSMHKCFSAILSMTW